jgi:hypothetical protein
MKVEENSMRTERTHLYKITREEAAAALEILKKQGEIVDKLERLLTIRTGKQNRLIGQGFRNDIKMIINATNKHS